MNFEALSYIFAIALSLSAVASPIITAIINNNHQLEVNKQNNKLQLQLKDLELYFPAKNEAIDNYLQCLSNYLNFPNDTNLYNYQVSMAKVSMYVSGGIKNAISSIDMFINEKNLKKASELISDYLSSELYKENIKKSTSESTHN